MSEMQRNALHMSYLGTTSTLPLEESHKFRHNNNSKNDIKEIKNIKQLEKVELDLDSPRLIQAMENLGITK